MGEKLWNGVVVTSNAITSTTFGLVVSGVNSITGEDILWLPANYYGNDTAYYIGSIGGSAVGIAGGVVITVAGGATFLAGGGTTAGGMGLTMTGGGSLVGVPATAAGVAIAGAGAVGVVAGMQAVGTSGQNLSDNMQKFKEANKGETKGGRQPENLEEQLAMEQAKSNPAEGRTLKLSGGEDPRWPTSEGWMKKAQNINGVEVHYQYNPTKGLIDDFKIK